MLDTLEREAPVIELTRHDRCDGCSAQAQIVAARDGHILMFCGHHGRRHTPALIGSGWAIHTFEEKESNGD